MYEGGERPRGRWETKGIEHEQVGPFLQNKRNGYKGE
jgi:hypothetical protein